MLMLALIVFPFSLSLHTSPPFRLLSYSPHIPSHFFCCMSRITFLSFVWFPFAPGASTAGREDGGDGEEESHRAAWQVQVQEDSKTRVDESHKVHENEQRR